MAVLESFFSRSHEGHRLECQILQHTNHWSGFLLTQIFLFIDRTNLSRWRERRSVSEEKNPSCFDSSDRDIDVVFLILEEANKFHLCKTVLLCVYSVFSRSCRRAHSLMVLIGFQLVTISSCDRGRIVFLKNSIVLAIHS